MIVPRIHRDHWSLLGGTYSKTGLGALGVKLDFVQDNVLRSVIRGSILDVTVDLG